LRLCAHNTLSATANADPSAESEQFIQYALKFTIESIQPEQFFWQPLKFSTQQFFRQPLKFYAEPIKFRPSLQRTPSTKHAGNAAATGGWNKHWLWRLAAIY
jgi:hypothetical protein